MRTLVVFFVFSALFAACAHAPTGPVKPDPVGQAREEEKLRKEREAHEAMERKRADLQARIEEQEKQNRTELRRLFRQDKVLAQEMKVCKRLPLKRYQKLQFTATGDWCVWNAEGKKTLRIHWNQISRVLLKAQKQQKKELYRTFYELMMEEREMPRVDDRFRPRIEADPGPSSSRGKVRSSRR